MKSNSIGLDKKKSEALADGLNALLADYHIFYQNLRGFHWNIKGKLFFELHLKFEEYYTNALLKIDEIAERILTLEKSPLHSFSAFLKSAEIKPVEGYTDGRAMVQVVLENLQVLIAKERRILTMAQDAGDEGTASIIGDYIQQQEKTVWMLRAYSD